MPLLSQKEALKLKLKCILAPQLKALALNLGISNTGSRAKMDTSEIIKRILEKHPDEEVINEFIKRKYEEKIQKRKSKKRGRTETYLEAMLKVYSEMYKVLKPGGLAIIVIKPFIRHKKVVDLPYHTWLLLRKVGFKLIKVYKLRLKTQSFWRIIYYKKYPEVPQLKHEYILILQKPVSS